MTELYFTIMPQVTVKKEIKAHFPPFSGYQNKELGYYIYSNFQYESKFNFLSKNYRKAVIKNRNLKKKMFPKKLTQTQVGEEERINFNDLPDEDKQFFLQNPEVHDHVWKKNDSQWQWYCEKVSVFFLFRLELSMRSI